jgi:H+-transporting ATPase
VSGATDAARAAAAIVLITPGLSVIIDAIKESRKIFQRMNSYAIYRIAETLRVLFFMTLAILIFNFYPVTAVMIVMLALLNDGAILSIAYDNVHYKDQPEAWNMRMVLGISTVLGFIGVVAAFGLFYLAERVFHLDRAHAQTMMYLKLSVAGHLTIFLTRTRGPFWSIRPAKILWMAVLGTQITATLFAVYGFLMTPLGWRWALFVWGYALAWFLVNDRVKLLAYRIFDRPDVKSKAKAEAAAKSDEKAKAQSVAKPEAEVGPKPEPNAAAKSDAKAALIPQTPGASIARAQAEPKLEANAKTTVDLTPRIAKRAYKLYEEGGRKDGGAVQNWEKAESEIRKDLARSEPSGATTAESEPEVKDPPLPQPQTKTVPKSDMKLEPQAEGNAGTPADVPPQLIKRVHALYEELGRQDVQTVLDWEQARGKIRKE